MHLIRKRCSFLVLLKRLPGSAAPSVYLLLSLQLEIMEVMLNQCLVRQSKSSGYSVALGSLPGCPVLVPGHSHMNGILEWSLGSHIHQLEFLPYSAAIFRALHFGLFETEARVSRLLMEKVGLSLL